MFRCWQNLYSGQSGLTSMSNSDNQTVGTACAGPGAAGATVLLLENEEVYRLAGDAVPILRQHHGDAPGGHQITHAVHARPY